MDVPVYLTHTDAAGAKNYIPLDLYDTLSTFFLPDSTETGFDVSRTLDYRHTSIRLDVEQEYCLLSVYSNHSKPIVIIGDCHVEMPVSTPAHQKSILLTNQQQFITAAGRWQVEWDRAGTISHSMRPTPVLECGIDEDEAVVDSLELVTTEDGIGLVELQEQEMSMDEEQCTGIPVVEIRLSPSTSEAQDTNDHTLEIEGTSVQRVENSNDLETQTGSLSSLYPLTPSSNNSADVLSSQVEATPSQPNDRCCIDENRNEDDQSNTTGSLLTHKEHLANTIIEEVEETHLDSSSRSMGNKDHTHILVNDMNTTRLLPQLPENQNVVQLENKLATNIDSNETNLSENESQQQKDTRMPKRRLQEIELGVCMPSAKRQKVDKGATNIVKARHGEQENQDENDSSKHQTKTEPKKMVKFSKDSIITKEVSKTPKVRSKVGCRSKAKRIIATTSPSSGTDPIRRSSRRQSEIPGPAPSSSPMSSEYGRPKVIFASSSSMANNKKARSTVERLGGTVVTDIGDANVLCIGNGVLKKTSKFVIAVAKGKTIVTDDWVKQAQTDQKFPATDGFLPKAPKQEKEWGFSLAEAIDRGKRGLKLLQEFDVYLTAQVRKDLGSLSKELKAVALVLGASNVHSCLPPKSSKHKVLVIGSVKNTDPEAAEVGRLGHKLYGQDVLTMAALRGILQLDTGEFSINMPVKKEQASQ